MKVCQQIMKKMPELGRLINRSDKQCRPLSRLEASIQHKVLLEVISG